MQHSEFNGKRAKVLTFILLLVYLLSFTGSLFAQTGPEISGVIFFYPSKVKMSNVKLTFPGVGETFTNSIGYYSMQVPAGWSGTVTPSCPGYNFSDSTRTYTNLQSDIQLQDYWQFQDPVVQISGQITHEANSAGLQGVLLNFSNGGGTALTDNEGKYVHEVPYKWHGISTPSKAGFSFSATYINYDTLTCYQYDKNYTAANGPALRISGKAFFLNANEPIANAQVTFSNPQLNVLTNANGEFQGLVPYLWSGNITISKDGYVFDPSVRPYTNTSANVSGQNFWVDGAPVDTISGVVTWGESGPGIENVILYYGSSGDSVLTNNEGKYKIGVPYNWSGEIIPVRNDWLFNPDTLKYTAIKTDMVDEDIVILGPENIKISGTITDPAGTGVANVMVKYDITKSVLTNGAGFYEITVKNGWSGTVKPSQENYMFEHASRTYAALDTHQVAQNYNVLGPVIVHISGRVGFNGGADLQGAAVLYGSNPDTVFTDASGNYTVAVPFDWTGNIWVEKECYAFLPLVQSYENIRAHVQNRNYDVNGTPKAVISGIVRYEPQGTGLADVIMTWGMPADTVWTKSDGRYEILVDLGWTGTVTPSKNDLLFEDAVKSYTNMQHHDGDENYKVLGPAIVTVSGKVYFSPGNEGINETIIYYGDAGDSVITDVNGTYSFTVPNAWSGVVRAAKTAHNFQPATRPLTGVNDHLPNQNFWVQGTPQLTIEGEIQGLDGNGLSNAILNYNASDTVMTKSNGSYKLTVPFAWSGRIIPEKGDLLFSPANKEYELITLSQTGQNYAELGPQSVNVSGKLYFSPGGEPLANTAVYYGSTGDSVVTDATGFYSFVVQNGWTGIVKPRKTDYDFEPSSRPYADINGHKETQDFWVAGSPELKISGHAADADGNNLAGVQIHYNNTDFVLTDADGNYNFTVPFLWSGTIRAEKDDLIFVPASLTYEKIITHQADQDFRVLGPGLINISGTLYFYPGKEPITETAVYYGSNGDSVVTDGNGKFSINVANGWSGEVIPRKSGYEFEPYKRPFTEIIAHATDQDFWVEGSPLLTIAGTIKNVDASPLTNAEISYGAAAPVLTDNVGHYEFTVPFLWSGIVTPAKDGLVFAPQNKSYQTLTAHQTEQNYQVIGPGQVAITGKVYYYPGNEPIRDVVVYYGSTGDSVKADTLGNYLITVASGWSGILTPVKTGHDFEPSLKHYNSLTSHKSEEDFWVEGTPQVIISGVIKDSHARVCKDINLYFGATDSVTTDAAGKYNLTVEHGWTGQVKAGRGVWLFEPKNRQYAAVSSEVVNQDYENLGPVEIKVSGTIYNEDAAVMAGVQVVYHNESSTDTVLSQGNGKYQFTVANGWSGLVKAHKDSLLFLPVERVYTALDTHQVGHDLHAVGPARIMITGKIVNTAGVPTAGVTMIYGSIHDTTKTDANGNFRIAVDNGWSGTITPSVGKHLFTPIKRQYKPLFDHVSDQTFVSYPVESKTCAVIAAAKDSIIDKVLFDLNIFHVFCDTLPGDLKDYDFCIVADTGIVKVAEAEDLAQFAAGGGGVILLGRVPQSISETTESLTAIKYWFGAGSTSEIKLCIARTITTNVLGSEMYAGAIVARCGGDTAVGINHLVNDAIPISRWEADGDNVHSFVKLYESGKVGYISYLDVDMDNSNSLLSAMCSWVAFAETAVEQSEESIGKPEKFELLPCYPNPFNPSTTITYRLAKTGLVKLEVFDIKGRLVNVLVEGIMNTGQHQVVWQANDLNGQAVSSGLYIARLTAGSKIRRMKMLFTK